MVRSDKIIGRRPYRPSRRGLTVVGSPGRTMVR
jgi:hypothetical protein